MAAGVLAAIGAFGQLVGGVLDIVIGSVLPDLFSDSSSSLESGSSWLPSYLVVIGVVGMVSGVLLGTGAVMMFRRKPLGRILIVAGCVVTVVTGIVAFVVMYAGNMSVYHGPAGLMGGFGGVIGQVFPVTTAVLALVPATARWLAHVPGQLGSAGYTAPYPGPGFPLQGAPPVDPFRSDSSPYAGQPGAGASYVGQPGTGASYLGQSGAGASYAGQPGAGVATPFGGQTDGGAAAPFAGQSGPAPAVPPTGQPGSNAASGQSGRGLPGAGSEPVAGGVPQMPYSHEPTPFPEVPPLGEAGAEQWRRPEK